LVLTIYELFEGVFAGATGVTAVAILGCSLDGVAFCGTVGDEIVFCDSTGDEVVFCGTAGDDGDVVDDGQSSCSLLSVDVFVVCDDDEGHNSVSL
jgi:hypothetical protein